nr:Chain A, decapeptide SVRDELRWVF [synthetic construct]7CO5_C Chain C, decapeptide SVRDELRWVF [synthetic construct]7CO5_E Chain E, decapeptide SVRDELRWVF [synthetic construct]7CO5_G Chain G, decapeptide SVRDELRWVF [synthetic construct]7CO5_I Chain I, decapeptide SVRDELRWVF [synthetic construct]7CO5_K Chain K, decapeptide SVRDELRWVF [synthetic construct]7CO7_C Chain C, decapeptide SVRDELRWVF [synthetic construct]
SVRDELRWVF